MKDAYVTIDPVTTNKHLLFEFNTGSLDLFPYVNATAGIFNYPIECYCFITQQTNFLGATPKSTLKSDLNCYLKFPQGNNIHTSISVDLKVPVNNYAKCFFPGFKTAPISL
jgi:hypothetical protein